MKTFNEKLLATEISQLPKRNQIIFALLAATRQLQNFEYYAKEIESGYLDRPRNILHMLWGELKNSASGTDDHSELYDEILNNLPNEDVDWTVWHALADDALSSIAYSIKAFDSSDVQHIVWSARRAYEAADQAAIVLTNIDLSSSNAELTLLSHPIVQKELASQNSNINLLKNELSVDAIEKMQAEAFVHSFLVESEIVLLKNSKRAVLSE